MNRGKWIGAGLMMAAVHSLIRLFSLSFQAFLTDRLGAETMGLFSLTQSVHSLAITFSVSGLSLSVTRLCAGKNAGRRSVLRHGMLLGAAIGTAAGAVLFLTAPLLSARMLHEPRTVLPLRLFALLLPILPLNSCVHGALMAERRVGQIMCLNVLETVLSAIITGLLLFRSRTGDFETACVIMTLSDGTAQIAVLLFGRFVCLSGKTPEPVDRQAAFGHAPEKPIRSLLRILLPVSAGACVRAVLRTTENLMIPAALTLSGMTNRQALAQYGLYKSVAMPAVMAPSGVVAAYASLLVPEIARHGRETKLPLGRILALTLFYASLCGGTLFLNADAAAALLGGGRPLAELLTPLSLAVPVWYLDSVTDSVVNALDGQRYALRYNLIEACCRLMMMKLLIPRWGMGGYFLSLICCGCVNLFCSVRCLSRLCAFAQDFTGLIPAFAGGIACALFGRTVSLLFHITSPVFALLFSAPPAALMMRAMMARLSLSGVPAGKTGLLKTGA